VILEVERFPSTRVFLNRMINRLVFAKLTVLFFSSVAVASETAIKQAYRVCKSGDYFLVPGAADDGKVCESAEANTNTVIQLAINAWDA